MWCLMDLILAAVVLSCLAFPNSAAFVVSSIWGMSSMQSSWQSNSKCLVVSLAMPQALHGFFLVFWVRSPSISIRPDLACAMRTWSGRDSCRRWSFLEGPGIRLHMVRVHSVAPWRKASSDSYPHTVCLRTAPLFRGTSYCNHTSTGTHKTQTKIHSCPRRVVPPARFHDGPKFFSAQMTSSGLFSIRALLSRLLPFWTCVRFRPFLGCFP